EEELHVTGAETERLHSGDAELRAILVEGHPAANADYGLRCAERLPAIDIIPDDAVDGTAAVAEDEPEVGLIAARGEAAAALDDVARGDLVPVGQLPDQRPGRVPAERPRIPQRLGVLRHAS